MEAFFTSSPLLELEIVRRIHKPRAENATYLRVVFNKIPKSPALWYHSPLPLPLPLPPHCLRQRWARDIAIPAICDQGVEIEPPTPTKVVSQLAH